MMRLLMGSLWMLALFVLWTQDGRGDPAGARAGESGDWPKKVVGWGLDLKMAKKDALKEAQKEIVACLRRHQPPLASWVPAEEYIENHLLLPEEKGEDFQVDKGKTAKRLWLFLKQPDWESFTRLDKEAQAIERGQRGQERLIILARVLAGLLVLLAAVAGCIRLDQWTHGSYRRWLQLAGASLVVASWAGLWLLI
jgi:hypothetical protein